MANGRKWNNTIEIINDDTRRQIITEEHKRSYFFHAFERLFEQIEKSPPSFGDWSGLYHSNRLLNPNLLTSLFSIEEVKTATFPLGSDKLLDLTVSPQFSSKRFGRRSRRISTTSSLISTKTDYSLARLTTVLCASSSKRKERARLKTSDRLVSLMEFKKSSLKSFQTGSLLLYCLSTLQRNRLSSKTGCWQTRLSQQAS